MTTEPPVEQSLDEDNKEFEAERDGVASLHDTEAESGDEAEVDDTYAIDMREARELGADLDDAGPDEPLLN